MQRNPLPQIGFFKVIDLTPDYPELAGISFIFGITLICAALFSLVFPLRARRICEAFPRSRPAAAVLTLAALFWSAIWLYVLPLGFVAALRPYIWILLPVSVAAVWICIPELLACRAAGGLLVLLPSPLLSAARWHPSPWRYVIIALAYFMVLLGMCYIAWPWMLRDNILFLWRKPRRAKAIGIAALCIGILLVVLSLTEFTV